MTPPLVVPHRFRGPARSGNGGWTAGALAERLAASVGDARRCPAVEVTLRRPPPLDTELDVGIDPDAAPVRARLAQGADVVAEAVCTDRPLTPLEIVDPLVAEAAMVDYPGHRVHPFPECFACGPARAPGDGLRIFPGPVPGRVATVASLWVPHASLAESGDVVDVGVERVGLATTWAALDCVGGWSEDLEGRPCVLGRMAARVDALPVVGERHVAIGQLLGADGRKSFTASTLYDADGRVVATAEHVWIAVDPSAFN
ncbi:MAG: hypothetical protein ACLGH4_02110 [Actinomycetes bacterium]